MELSLRLAALLLLAAGLLAAVYQPPRQVVLSVYLPLAGGEGSPLDTGIWGRSVLVHEARLLGHPVAVAVTGLEPVRGGRYLLLLLGPTNCNDTSIPEWVREALAKGAEVELVASVEWSCPLVNKTLEALGAPPVTLHYLTLRGMLLASTPQGSIAVYTARVVGEAPGYDAYAIEAFTGEIIGVYRRAPHPIIFIADSHLFTNAMLNLTETGQARLLEKLLSGGNYTVVIPLEACRAPALQLGIRLLLHPTALLLALHALAARLDMLTAAVASRLGAPEWLLYGVSAGAAAAIIAYSRSRD